MLITVMVLVICGIVTYKRQGLDKTCVKDETRIEELNKDIANEMEEAEKIQELKAYVQTKKYIEEVAREKLGLVYEDEIIFKSENKE